MNPHMIYVIAGEGDNRPCLEQLARDAGIENDVKFIGKIPDEQLVELYRTAEIFVMPSTGEGFGIVFLEAMATGIPVIGGNADGSTDPLQDGILGTAVEEDAMLSAIEEALVVKGKAMEKSMLVKQYFGKENFSEHLQRIVTASIQRSAYNG